MKEYTCLVSVGRPYRTRFAPSPTGALHLGHARTHLVTWLRARQAKGAIVMRIEDLDPPRVVAGAEDALLRDHEWLGLDWDEGPIRQSERSSFYEDALEQLRLRGLIYGCTCSRKEIQQIASAPHGEEAVYPGTCRAGPTRPGRPESLRFRFEEPSPGFDDALHGPIAEGSARGDFVVRRADGLWAYQLAVVVDDAEQGITEVVRGEDLLGATPRQIALYRALGRTVPGFLHLPLVLDAAGTRLSKRSGSIAIADHRRAGLEREQLLGLLAASLGLLPTPRPIELDELLHLFSIEAIHRPPATLEPILQSAPR